MKIEFKNLGCIEEGSVELKDLTIFCGKNNTGKTYVMYSLYALLNNKFNINFEFVKPLVDKLKQENSVFFNMGELIAEHKEDMLNSFQQSFKNYLPILFGVSNHEFLTTEINLHFFESDLNKVKNYALSFVKNASQTGFSIKINDTKGNITFNEHNVSESFLQTWISNCLIAFIVVEDYSNCFLLPAERDGLNLFYKELFSVRNLLIQQAQNDNVNPMNLLKDILSSRYAEPIKDYLQFLNRLSTTKNDTSNYAQYAQIIEKNIVHGKYEVDDFGSVFFIPEGTQNKLPLHFSSSTAKTLFGLVFYLEHLAKENDCLMFDEPELNLHPENQRQMARVLAQLVNARLKVIVSTHSNHFVRELNNLIMLQKEFKGVAELRETYNYQAHELLDSKKIAAYLFDDKKIIPMEIDEDEGIIAETFDRIIGILNKASDDIYYTIQDAKDVM